MATIDQVLQQHQQRLVSLPGVTSVGEGEEAGQPVIRITVKNLTPELRRELPQQLGGFAVKIEVSGEISAF
jgi:hypothetical protein